MRDSDWSTKFLLRSDWLPIHVAPMTTVEQQQKLNKSLLEDLPYFNVRTNLVLTHGQVNNSLKLSSRLDEI